MSRLRYINLPHRETYIGINLESLLDSQLTWTAKGIHAYLITSQDYWEDFSPKQLQSRGKASPQAYDAAIEELIQHGYLAIHHDGDEEVWHVTESPLAMPLTPAAEPGQTASTTHQHTQGKGQR